MSFPPGGRRLRRVIGGTLVVTATAMGLMSLAPASHADDDYPYRGLGQCPLVPLPPKPTTGPDHSAQGQPSKPPKPGSPGHQGHGTPGNPTTKPGDSGPP